MNIIVGLGNPGTSKIWSPQNAGYWLIDSMALTMANTYPRLEMSEWKLSGQYMLLAVKTDPITLLVKLRVPYMASARAIKKLKDFYKIGGENLWVAYGEPKLEINKHSIEKGKIQTKEKVIKEIEDSLGISDFWKIMVGVKSNNKNLNEIDLASVRKVGEIIAKRSKDSLIGNKEQAISKKK